MLDGLPIDMVEEDVRLLPSLSRDLLHQGSAEQFVDFRKLCFHLLQPSRDDKKLRPFHYRGGPGFWC